ncbi:hypothetical protein UlMin_005928 [Ulmus minor]
MSGVVSLKSGSVILEIGRIKQLGHDLELSSALLLFHQKLCISILDSSTHSFLTHKTLTHFSSMSSVFNMDKYLIHDSNSSPKPDQPTEPLIVNVSPQTEPLKEPKTEDAPILKRKPTVQFNQSACRQKLCEMIVIDELPFNHVEGQGFKSFCTVMQPKFVMPSRMTVKRDVVKLYFSEMAKLKKRLIESCLQNWGIEKVYTITLDNASANDVAVGNIKRRVNGWNGAVLDGDYMHVRCAAHIINLIVDSGLKEMHEYIRLSTARLEKFAMCVSKEKIEFKGKLILDCSIRWNSTYKMLHVALKCQKAFERYEEEDDKYIVHFQEDEGGKKKVGPPSTHDWNNARIFVNFLQSFYDVTLKYKMGYVKFSLKFFYDAQTVTRVTL